MINNLFERYLKTICGTLKGARFMLMINNNGIQIDPSDITSSNIKHIKVYHKNETFLLADYFIDKVRYVGEPFEIDLISMELIS